MRTGMLVNLGRVQPSSSKEILRTLIFVPAVLFIETVGENSVCHGPGWFRLGPGSWKNSTGVLGLSRAPCKVSVSFRRMDAFTKEWAACEKLRRGI